MDNDLLYDAVDPKFAEPMPANGDCGRTFVFAGNYIPGKGQDIALEAMSRVALAFPDARLEFYGGDMGLEKNREFRRALVKRAEELGLSGCVHFGDFVKDTTKILRGKLAALNLSRSEAFSLAVLEASAAGLPVIATRSGGPEEILEDGKTGFLVPIDDASSCAEVMIRLCRDQNVARDMGERGRKRVLHVFSQRNFRKQLFPLLGLI
ncbi:hypothetical protein GCM10019059_40210 [Camelimonas fluminis]|nr:hypothetical protein GCM10019059_40210 [Camelimonas fluminis]